jgi:hypothetical protein
MLWGFQLLVATDNRGCLFFVEDGGGVRQRLNIRLSVTESNLVRPPDLV